MIKGKKVIGVCITKIQENDRMVYLDRLHRYANRQGHKLMIFNSFVDYNTGNSFHDDECTIYELMDFHVIDLLAVHSKSFPEGKLPDALLCKAEACNIPLLSETEFLEDTDETVLTSELGVNTRDSVYELHHTIKDSMFQEDFMYAWLAQVVSTQDINRLYSLLTEVILYGSHICLNNTFLDLLIHNPPAPAKGFSDELILLSSQPAQENDNNQSHLMRSRIIPNHEEWADDTTAYILNTIHAEKKIYGYYAFRTDNPSDMAVPLKRVVSALNLAFCIVSKQFSQNDSHFSIKQAVMAQTDVHLPLNLLIERNLFFYHFQPIVNAHDGSIFAYEALMRTDPVIYMSPLEVIDAASAYGRLYDIEKATMYNTLAYINEHQELFSDCKLFVNSIPAYMLNTEDWNVLVEKYGHLMEKLVIEMTEQTEMDNDRISVIRNRLKTHNISLAIDDYGTGFSNISNLIRYNPNYVKIDRSLVEHIQDKPRIQKLVAGIIEFVHENGYFALAEGVETHEELKTMTTLGSDLIQGYYLAKPTPYVLRELPNDLQNEIIDLNRMRSEYAVRVYRPKEGETVDLAQITAEHYNALLIETENVTIQGVLDTAIQCSVAIRDGLHTRITLKDVHIITEKEVPLIDLGNFTNATIVLKGDNKLINRGIRVPQNSDLRLTGEGSLHIHCEMLNSYGIGNDRDNSYGNIHIDFVGILHIDINGENSIAIGGGKNDASSIISIRQTKIHLEGSGNNCVGIGNFDGNCIIDIKNSKQTIEISSATAVGIGCVTGNANILIEHYKTIITESGIGLCGIGVLHGGKGRLIVAHGAIICDIRGRNIVCFGTDGGSLDCSTLLTSTDFYCEGNSVTGIGDINGSGNINLRDSNLAMRILARDNLDIGSKFGKLETVNIQKQIKVNE